MMRNLRGRIIFAWVVCAAVTGLALFDLVTVLVTKLSTSNLSSLDSRALFTLVPALFAIPAALIITRLPRNLIGWLLMTPALVLSLSNEFERYLSGFAAPPPASLPVMLMMLFSGLSWLGLIFPILFIPLLFPTGRPLTPRWRWPLFLAAGMIVFFLFFSGFSRVYSTEGIPWSLANPVGFIGEEDFQLIAPFWGVLLAVMAGASLASIIVRYRRASIVERQQMKWLLYACALFGLVYIPSAVYNIDPNTSVLGGIWNIIFALAILAIPAGITIAILRYHLFDIDVIIRLTLVFTLLTALLALVYAGGIILLQAGFRTLTGQKSDLAVMVTTLVIVVLFNPLRQRIQAVIDRRFYRQKYNAEQAVAEFAAAARGGSDLDALSGMLVELVLKTLQPTQVDVLYMNSVSRSQDGISPSRGLRES